MAPLIFISYRSDDSDIVRALELALGARLGRSSVLRDRTSMAGGSHLRQAITDDVARADVIVAVIGSSWDMGAAPGERRLDRGDDWVRFELSLALAWRKLVVPVLLDGASMPRPQELPTDIRDLADRVALPLRDSDWHHDIENLMALIAPGRRTTRTETPTVAESGPVAGGDVVLRGDIVAGRDMRVAGAGEPE